MNRKYNIAILIPGLSGGGAERVAARLSLYFTQQGWNVYYFVDQRKRGEEYFHKGKVVQVLPECEKAVLVHSTNLFYQFRDLLVKGKVIKKLKARYQIDVAISFMDEYNLLNVLSKGREQVVLRICDIMSLSGVAESVHMNFPHRMIGWLYNRADKIVVMSDYGKKDMAEKYHVLPGKLVKIPNPLVRQKEILRDEKKAWTYGDKVILAVGRVVEIKQQEQLIKCMPYILSRCSEARLVIVGASHGTHSERLKQLVNALGVEEAVLFVGHQSNVKWYYQNSRVFALVSKSEGYPNAMIEALDEGIPVVAADCPGAAREILGYEKLDKVLQKIFCKNGILIPELTENALDAFGELTERQQLLAEAILQVLTNEEIYLRYKGAAKEYTDELALDKIGAVWRSYFERE